MNKNIVLGAVLWASILMIVSILIPGILVNQINQDDLPDLSVTPPIQLKIEQGHITIPIYLTKEKRIETVPLEHYVRGVLAAEMPIEFELEALKAQAIAARTYIINRMIEQNFTNVPVEGAWVTDTVAHQAYLTEEAMQREWDVPTYAMNLNKINQAVNETRGLIATYENRPINATFFSTSNGYTENSEDYWNMEIPYLRSVVSPWDQKISPKYKVTVSFPQQEVYEKLGLSQEAEEFKILEMTEGKRVKAISIGDKVFSGREVREKLGLNSSQFNAKPNGSNIEFTTYGYGHGVGMSQWGAQGMAKEGKKAEQIIKHYYQNVEIERVQDTI